VRRRNSRRGAEMPVGGEFDEPGAEELILDSGDYPALLDKALKHFKWDEVQAEVKRRRAAGEAVGTGIGLFVEESGRGPADGAKISVDTDGTVEVVTGGASIRQGFATAMAQICAQQRGVDDSRT